MTGSPCYQFLVDALMSERALAAFPELDFVVDDEHATTSLVGRVADRTTMRSIVTRLEDLGFTLLEMRRITG
ncbi:hypothetical protein [Rhodococcus opacus]|uniref:Uncharacterized protein n=1 Tax=Rhodococcus opacus TaxID=37919 RepID=A0A2S8J978_RHOOP|nr:hypothetical protein [Rhodococcus opacus]PQP23604.1 hypothetical protein C5613_17640 [Rhodococcus opacus]